VNCGFGGSRTDDVLYYAQRILQPLRPTRIVYYCGSNDVATTRPATTVLENFKSFVSVVKRELPGTKIYFISENVSPKRMKVGDEMLKVNTTVSAWVKTVSGVYYIDATPGLFDTEGKPKVELFVKDGVHLNPEGNKIWMGNITKGLEQ
jgi:lysophospholipase L1-like esterase